MIQVVSNLLPTGNLTALSAGQLQQGQFALPQYKSFSTQIDVDASGTALRLDWPRISGATEIALETARIVFSPPTGVSAGLDLGDLKGAYSGKRCAVPIPDSPRQVRSLHLSGLRLNDANDTPLRDVNALVLAGVRVAVAASLGGVLAPVGYAVPSIPPNPSQPPYVTPPLLAGAWLDADVLALPDVMADELQIMVVEGSDPEDFAPVSFSLDGVSARSAPSPLDLSVLDGDGAAFYTGTGPITSSLSVDAKNAVRRALEAAIDMGEEPSVELTVTSRTPGIVQTLGILATGEVRRVFDDKITATLEGMQVVPALSGPPLDPQTPASATADLVIEHAGVRLHDLSDTVPSSAGPLSGSVLTMEAPLWRALPPEGLRGEVLRRIGLVGYGLEAATLSLRVLGATPDGSKVAPPDLATGTCEIATPNLTLSQPAQVYWFDLGEGLAVDQPIGFEVTAKSGRFLWVAEAETLLARFAVSHDLSGAETLAIGSQHVPITAARTVLNGFSLTPAVFAKPPSFDSDQFLTFTLSRLTLGYAP